MSPRSVLLAGGTGFVGRHCAQTLERRGWQVALLSRGPRPAWWRGHHHQVDLAGQPQTLRELVAGVAPQVIVNLVGSIWGHQDAQMEQACLAPTVNLLDAVAAAPVRPWLVHVGSVLEYGAAPSASDICEHAATTPDTAYGRAKLAASQAVLAADDQGSPAMVLRVANVCGPGLPEISLLGRVARALCDAALSPAARGRVELAPLLAHRDYVDVRDVADAVAAACDMGPAARGRAIPIGRGEAVAVRDLVRHLMWLSQIPADLHEVGEVRPGALSVTVDPRPAAELLGWSASISPERSLQDFWAHWTTQLTTHDNMMRRAG